MNIDIERMQTNMSPEWIKDMAAKNPAVLLDSGNIRVFCRGAFVNAAQPGKDRVENGVLQKGKYGMNCLFVPDYDVTALVEARKLMLPTAFPKNPQGLGLTDPLKDQGEKVAPSEGGTNKKGQTTAGFVPGCKYISPNANLDYPPSLSIFEGGKVVPAFGDKAELAGKFYSGAWYFATISVFHGANPQNPNVFYGLSSVLKIANDRKFSGGGGDGAEAFAGINIAADGIVDPQSLM